MGFMKPSTPSASAPEQTIPVKAESVEQEVGEDYQARERQRQGMISTILARGYVMREKKQLFPTEQIGRAHV